MSKRKLLILTVTAGQGHNAVASVLEKRFQGNFSVKKIDLFKEFNSKIKYRFFNRDYMFLCKHFLWLYNFLYDQAVKNIDKKFTKNIYFSILKKEKPKLEEYIKSFSPDFIICTHFAPAMILSELKESNENLPPFMFVMTDFELYPFLSYLTNLDYISYPCEKMENTLLQIGFTKKQLLQFGIPTKMEFANILDKSTARKKLGISEEVFTIMIMNGSGGTRNNYKILESILSIRTPLQIIIINGTDKKAKELIRNIPKEKLGNHKILNFGYASNIHLVMSASDIMIGKCGGISTCEAMNSNLPMLVYSRLPRHEEGNFKFLNEYHTVLNFSNYEDLKRKIRYLISNPDEYKKIKGGLCKIASPDSLEKYYAFIDEKTKTEEKKSV